MHGPVALFARGPRRFPAKYKAKILAVYDTLGKVDKGILLRRDGLYSSLLTEWRKQRDRGAVEAPARPAGRQATDPRDREVARLKKDNQRLAGELDKAKKVIEVPGHSRRCWSSSPPTAWKTRGARRSDRPGRRWHTAAVVTKRMPFSDGHDSCHEARWVMRRPEKTGDAMATQ